jgi:hypothetical protein
MMRAIGKLPPHEHDALRDDFAGRAMQAILASATQRSDASSVHRAMAEEDMRNVARHAYGVADVMLEVRELTIRERIVEEDTD